VLFRYTYIKAANPPPPQKKKKKKKKEKEKENPQNSILSINLNGTMRP
jgi:hypothetical protein